MIKIEHTLFALPFAFLGMLLAAGGWPSWRTVSGSWSRWWARGAPPWRSTAWWTARIDAANPADGRAAPCRRGW